MCKCWNEEYLSVFIWRFSLNSFHGFEIEPNQYVLQSN